MIKQVFKKILKVQQENGEKKKIEKINVSVRGIEPALSGRQASSQTITPFGPMLI